MEKTTWGTHCHAFLCCRGLLQTLPPGDCSLYCSGPQIAQVPVCQTSTTSGVKKVGSSGMKRANLQLRCALLPW